MSNGNGGYGVKAGRYIVAFMIFNFLVYKCPKNGLNCPKGRAKIMHKHFCCNWMWGNLPNLNI